MSINVETWIPSNLAELRDAVAEMIDMAMDEGCTPDTVYLNLRNISLDRSTLTDGSSVCDLTVRL